MASQEKGEFFEAMEAQHLALTFDDVRLITHRSDYNASEVDISSRFSRNVDLKVPLVSAAMDTVTTSGMAIAMAKLGGLGVVHAGLSIEDQKREVRKVKLSLNGLIENPVAFDSDRTLQSVLSECDDRGYKFRTFPVTKDGRLVGVVGKTDIDLQVEHDVILESFMVPLERVHKAHARTTVKQAYDVMQSEKTKTLPLVDEGGALRGLYLWSDVRRIVGGDAGDYNVDASGRLRVAAAVPTDDEAVERVREMRSYLDVVVIDTAQGDSKYAFQTLEALKSEFDGLDVVVGNVSSGESARDLAEAGADGIKVGQGPGSICTTRIETGIGMPQVTAVYECARAVANVDPAIPICADGGVKDRGDIAIAIAAGAHSVMMGGVLAGTDEAPGLVEHKDGRSYKVYRGMGSMAALQDSAASRKRYGDSASADPLPEGVETDVPYTGSVDKVVGDLVKALRKSLSYQGVENIEVSRQNTRLVRITNNGMHESRPHDVILT